MSLLKNWKLWLAAFGIVMLTACAGSSVGCTSEGGASDGAVQEAPKEVIDENKLKKAEEEAMKLTEENHKMRREIFESKNKLGMPTSPVAEEAPAEDAPAEEAAK